ncbi:hypothetical protein [Paracraurococcus ruber]|uniref:Uncharacterized protein n=1 Tax=Paracraurococcus ruber TaxID=77675 RepID=A0ABS1CS73_9PROT|nr:hypothetical protein [Paracraurococcus ruber]MBK1656689.1 hypothetical protein [Paracraurococcus ruber]TDG33693.1 hypothetical protein E2C05_02405 [Paracraurococcus ruber]
MIGVREARLDLDARLGSADPALGALLRGEVPHPLPAHPLFRHPAAMLLLTGESLDHATGGSRLVAEPDGGLRLIVSASLPADAEFLAAALDWLGGQVEAMPGDLLGFVVPPGSARHDMRLLAWHAGRLQPLPPIPSPGFAPAGPGCSLASFLAATGLPPPEAAEEDLLPEIRRVAAALAARRALPVAQARLDGPLMHGQASFLLWLQAVAAARLGFTTLVPALLVA